MKKKIMKRMWIGLPVGIAMGYIITLIISACIGDGSFYPVAPELVRKMSNELDAAILQTVLCAILGVGFAAASVIWELDSWSLAKQSGVYFLVIGVILLPIAYVTNWMQHSVVGFLSYLGIFIGIFFAAWLSQYLCWKQRIRKMNDIVRHENDRHGEEC